MKEPLSEIKEQYILVKILNINPVNWLHGENPSKIPKHRLQDLAYNQVYDG